MIRHNITTLMGVLNDAYIPMQLGIKPDSSENLRRVVRQFEAWAGHEVLLDELDDMMVAQWMGRLLESGLSPATVNGKRDHLLAVWRFAKRKHYTTTGPDDVPKVSVSREEPDAWTINEVQRLINTCIGWPGMVNRLPASWFWTALVLTGFYTALRIGSLLQLRTSQCDLKEGWIVAKGASQKARRFHVIPIPPVCIEALRRVQRPGQEMLLPWDMGMDNLFRIFGNMVDQAKLPRIHGKSQQLFHKLRRTAISYAAQVSAEDARKLAGHQNIATTWRHYINPRIAEAKNKTVLPRLNLPGTKPADPQLWLPDFAPELPPLPGTGEK